MVLSWLSKPLVKAGLVVSALAGLCVGGYLYGRHTMALEYEREARAALELALAEQTMLFNDQMRITNEYWKEYSRSQVRTVTEIKEVTKYVESDAGNDECLDPGGVQLVNQIIKSGVPPSSD